LIFQIKGGMMKPEQLETILDRDNWVCCYPGCNDRAVEPAHRISQNKGGRKYIKDMFMDLFFWECNKKVIDEIIHHPINVKSVCSNKAHNSFFAINPATKPLRAQKLVEEIYRNMVVGNML